LASALHATGVAAVMLDNQGRSVLQGETPSREESLPQFLPLTPLFDHLRESQGMFLSSAAASQAELIPLREAFLFPRKIYALMISPLNTGADVQGWYVIYYDQEHTFSSSEIELARTICNQAAISIQNARLFVETRLLTEDLEHRVEDRAHELRREHQNSQTLLHIITELSASLDMGLVLNRTLTVLNESLGSEEGLIIISQTSTQYRAGQQLDSLASGGSPAEKQIARFITRQRQPLILPRVQDDPRWQIAPDAQPAYQSVLGVPLVMGEEVLGAMLLFHRQANYFNQDLLYLLEATARQIAIALNNAELFNLIRDQSEHLGSMLREQQIEASRSRAILEAVADGVLVTNAQGGINLFNASAERILDLTSVQVLGKSLDQFVGLFGRTAADWMQTIRDYSQSAVAQKDATEYAEQIDLDNGRIVAVRLAPVYWRQEFLGTVSTFRDITHEVQVDRLKSEFVANVSHELRTPMTSIKGYVEIMLMGAAGTLNPQQVHFLNIVKSNTERLSVLVNDLLDVSRIEAGRVSLNFQSLDMREVAEDVIVDAQRRARDENKAMNFILDIPRGLPFAMGDVERVRQVLSSLVNNGYLYTPENGCVTVHINELDQAIQVDVEDNGIGIGEEEQNRIFERFYRGEDPLVLASAGTGLGLAIARTLIEMHKGRIWFKSSGVRGEGSTFSFTLPVQENSEE
jgi:PAS domain S-box-containing protein